MRYVAVYFPLADVRGFVPDAPRLDRPYWRGPTPGREFLRGVGPVSFRKSEGFVGGKRFFCPADRMVRFDDDLRTLDANARCAFRSLEHDGWGTGLVSVGLALDRPGGPTVVEGVRRVLSLRVSVRERKGKVWRGRLGEAGPALARAFQRSNEPRVGDPPLGQWVACEGGFAVASPDALEAGEEAGLDEIAIPGEAAGARRLLYLTLDFGGKMVPLWTVVDPARDSAVRNTLIQESARRECLRQVLRGIDLERIAPARGTRQSDDLQRYLQRSMERIRRLRGDANPHAALAADLIDRALEVAEPARVEALLESLDRLDMRPAVADVVKGFIKEGFGGKIIMGSEYKFENSQIGAVGENAKAEGFTQVMRMGESVDLGALATELAEIRRAMKANPTDDPALDAATGEVAGAETAAKAGDEHAVLNHLKAAGKWALDTATDVGAKIATELIKHQMGLG